MKHIVIKNLQLEDYKEYYSNVAACSRPIEFEGLACSNELIAFRCASFYGVMVGVMRLDAPLLNPKVFTLKGHQSSVQDIQFNPHNQQLLASSGDDCNVLLWDLSDLSDQTQSIMTLNEHTKRCSCITWNPVVANVLSSIGKDSKLVCWDMEKGKCMFRLQLDSIPYCCKWNTEGSLLSYIDENAMLNVVDIRLNTRTHTFKCHDVSKKSKLVWVDGLSGNSYNIISTGFGKGYFRQVKLWDLRNTSSAINVTDLDSSSSAVYPIYEEGLGILTLLGKGESLFRFLSCKFGTIKQIAGARSAISHACFGLAPKSLCFTEKCEVLKFFNTQSGNVYTTSVIVPRLNKGTFSSDLYPDIISSPTYSIQEWRNLEKKPIIRTPFMPSITPSNSASLVYISQMSPKLNSLKTFVPPPVDDNAGDVMNKHTESDNVLTHEASHSEKNETVQPRKAMTSRKTSSKITVETFIKKGTLSLSELPNERPTKNHTFRKSSCNCFKPLKTITSLELVYSKNKKNEANTTKKTEKEKSMKRGMNTNKKVQELSRKLEAAESENAELKKSIISLQNRMKVIEDYHLGQFNKTTIDEKNGIPKKEAS